MDDDTIEVTAAQPEPAMDVAQATDVANEGVQSAEAAKPGDGDVQADAETKPEGEGDAKGEKKPRGWVSTRINELTREKYAERDRATAAEAEAARLREEMAALKASSSRQGQAADVPDDFDPFDPKSIAKLVSEQAQKAVAEARQGWEKETAAKTFAERTNEFHAKIAETDEGALKLFHDPAAPITTDMAELIMRSADGVKIANHLGNHPDDLRRIATLDPVNRAYEIGRLEARLSAPPLKVTSAPPPPVTVGSRAQPDTGFREEMSQADFEAWYAKRYPDKRRA